MLGSFERRVVRDRVENSEVRKVLVLHRVPFEHSASRIGAHCLGQVLGEPNEPPPLILVERRGRGLLRVGRDPLG